MATTTDNGDGSFTLSSAGHSVTVKARADQDPPGWVTLDVKAEDGTHLSPFRVHITDSNGRVAGDFPTCNPSYCMVDETTGRIAEG